MCKDENLAKAMKLLSDAVAAGRVDMVSHVSLFGAAYVLASSFWSPRSELISAACMCTAASIPTTFPSSALLDPETGIGSFNPQVAVQLMPAIQTFQLTCTHPAVKSSQTP